MRDRFPGDAAGYCGAARALQRSGRLVEAEALLIEAMRRLPANPEPAIEYARLAEATDPVEAGRRWTFVKSRFPDE